MNKIIAEIMEDSEIPVEKIIIPQIIDEDGKRYEVYQEEGCISRICIADIIETISEDGQEIQKEVIPLVAEEEVINDDISQRIQDIEQDIKDITDILAISEGVVL